MTAASPTSPGRRFEGLTSGLTGSGLYAVEAGVRMAAGAAAVAWFNNKLAQPTLICKSHGAGKIVYMNLSMYRYGFSAAGVTAERRTPSGASATNIRQLVRNLLALGGVTPKVAIKQGWNNPAEADVYNIEKSLHVDGQNLYLGCVINSYADGDVAVVDLLTLVGSFGLDFGDAGYDSACDFNTDKARGRRGPADVRRGLRQDRTIGKVAGILHRCRGGDCNHPTIP